MYKIEEELLFFPRASKPRLECIKIFRINWKWALKTTKLGQREPVGERLSYRSIVSINIGVIVYFRLHQMKDSCIYILFAKVINVNIFIFHNPSSIVTHTWCQWCNHNQPRAQEQHAVKVFFFYSQHLKCSLTGVKGNCECDRLFI